MVKSSQVCEQLVAIFKISTQKSPPHELESYQDEQGMIHHPLQGEIWKTYKGLYQHHEYSLSTLSEKR